MNKKLESYKLVIIFLIFILIISIIGLMFYKNLSKDTTTTITATVKYKGNDYIVVADTNNKEYTLIKNILIWIIIFKRCPYITARIYHYNTY